MDVPIRFLPTQEIAPDTFLIRQLIGEGMAPLVAPLNTMVIRGEQPVIVDTGAAVTREGWLERAFEIVDPGDVRWVYLSHDDTDHTGAVFEVLDRAPNATVVTTWFAVERMAADAMLPLDRVRIVNPGESIDAGDRTLTAYVPPVFDSPTTRGLFDSKTGVLWGADAYGALVPHAADDVAEFDADVFEESFVHTQRMLSPWHQWLDPAVYGAHLDGLQRLGASVVASCHGVALRGTQIDRAYELTRRIPGMAPAPLMGQPDLDGLLAMLAATPQAQAA
ncbi:MAG TPA: MBL fold metallo-hydrolase [Acidimicrobiales bacterium]|jgi:flavorubredoxin|nr:MBL fold metallo-hydrolase [Acidimicrobiales bacterium]